MSIMKKYRLQLLSHGEIFNNREDAVRYINEHFKRYALWAEPAIVYYENSDGELRMIVAVGATQDPDHKRIYMMDDGLLREIVETSNDKVNEFADAVSTISDDLQSTIEAAGLTLNENSIQDRVEYHPNVNDTVINNATTIAEALEMVSAYAQEVMEFAEESKANDVVYKKRNSGHNVRINISDPEDDGEGHIVSYISADVKISEDEFNMLQVKDDRLFVPKISGGETDSTKTVVNQDLNGGYTVKTSVKDNFCTLTHDGNTIKLTVGDNTQTITLPGVEIVKRIEYDEENNKIIIVYRSGEEGMEESTVEFPVNDIFDFTEYSAKIDVVKHELTDLIAANVQNLSDTINGVVNDTENPKSNYSLHVRLTNAETAIEDIQETLSDGIELKQVDPNNSRLYGLYVNNVQHGTVIIPEDKFLSSVRYDESNHTLIFVWNDDAQTETPILIDNLIDLYTAGDGIEIDENNEISIKLSDDSSNLLEFVQGGYLKTKNVASSSDIDAVNDRIDTIADEYCTKDEVDAALVTKANVDDVYTKNEAQAKLVTSDTVSIDTVNGIASANVKVKHTVENDDNVIKFDRNGLFVNVNYNKATNTLSFNDKQIELSSHTILQNGYYDSANNEIVLVIKDDSTGESGTKEIRIPVSDLVEDMVKVGETNTVLMNISNDADKIITADVKLSTPTSTDEPDPDRRENAIITHNDGIFASKFADQYNAYYTFDNVTNIITVQRYLELLNSNIISLQTAIQGLTQRVNNVESILAEIIGDGAASDFADYGARIARLETMVGDYNDYQGDNDPSNDGWDNTF